jgi:hypothetical protein
MSRRLRWRIPCHCALRLQRRSNNFVEVSLRCIKIITPYDCIWSFRFGITHKKEVITWLKQHSPDSRLRWSTFSYPARQRRLSDFCFYISEATKIAAYEYKFEGTSEGKIPVTDQHLSCRYAVGAWKVQHLVEFFQSSRMSEGIASWMMKGLLDLLIK